MSFILANFLGPAAENSSETLAAQNHVLIEKICSKMVDSAHLEDRRAAAQSLKSLVRSNRLEIGTICLQSLLNELKRDLEDEDTAKAVLETLDILCSSPTRSSAPAFEDYDSENETKKTKFQGIEDQFCEILLKDNSNVALFLEIIGESDFYLKFTSIQLLISLCNSQPVQFQCAVLATPSGVSKILSLLEDEREVVRNEGIILAKGLVRGNSDLQKIVAFQGACEMVMKILVDEGGCWDGPLIVHDSLQFLAALLEFNTINQNYFRDSICFKQLAGLLAISTETENNKNLWNQTKISNYSAALNVFSVLLCRDNVDLEAAQNAALQTNYLIPLLILAFNPKIPISVSSTALNCLSSLIWSNLRAQAAFSKELLMAVSVTIKGLVLPCSPLMAAVLIALHGNVTQEGIDQRQNALLLIEAFCIANPDGQMVILSTMLKSDSLSIGSAIIDALLDTDASRKKDQWHCWFASNLLGHLINENDSAKEVLLKHQINEEDSEFEGESAFNILMLTLIKISRDSKCSGFQKSVIAYLSLLTIWLNESPLLIGRFLQEGSFVQYLIERVTQSAGYDIEVQGLSALILGLCVLFNDEKVVSFTSENIKGIIKNRIGPDLFISRITRLRYNRSKDEEMISNTVEGILIKNYESLIKLVGRPTPAGTTASHTATLAQLTTDLTSTRTLLIDTQSLLSKSNSLADTLKIGILERDTYISQLQKIISEKNQRLTQMAHDISHLEQEQMQQVLKNTENVNDNIKDEAQKESLIEQVNQYYQQYLSDQSAIETLNQTLQTFQETINHQQARIEELEHLLALSRHQNEPSQELEEWKRAYHELYDQMQEQVRINNDAIYYENTGEIEAADDNESVSASIFSNEELITNGIIELVDSEPVRTDVVVEEAITEPEQTTPADEPSDFFVMESSPSIESVSSNEQQQHEEITTNHNNFLLPADNSDKEHVEMLSPSQFMSPLQDANEINEHKNDVCLLENNNADEISISFEKVTYNVLPEVQEADSHYPTLPVSVDISRTAASIISEESAVGIEQAELVSLNELPDPNTVNFESNYPHLPTDEYRKNRSASIIAPLEINFENGANFISDETAPESFVNNEEEIQIASNQEIEQVLSFFDNLSVIGDTKNNYCDDLKSDGYDSDAKEELEQAQEPEIHQADPEISFEKDQYTSKNHYYDQIYRQAAEQSKMEPEFESIEQQGLSQEHSAYQQSQYKQSEESLLNYTTSVTYGQNLDQSYEQEQSSIDHSYAAESTDQYTEQPYEYSSEQFAYQSYDQTPEEQQQIVDNQSYDQSIDQSYEHIEQPREQSYEHSSFVEQSYQQDQPIERSSEYSLERSCEQPSLEQSFEQSLDQSHEQPSIEQSYEHPADQSYEQYYEQSFEQPADHSHEQYYAQSFEQPADHPHEQYSVQSYEQQQPYEQSYQQGYEDNNYNQQISNDQLASQPSYEQSYDQSYEQYDNSSYTQAPEQHNYEQFAEQTYAQSAEQIYAQSAEQTYDHPTDQVYDQSYDHSAEQSTYGQQYYQQTVEQPYDQSSEPIYDQSREYVYEQPIVSEHASDQSVEQVYEHSTTNNQPYTHEHTTAVEETTIDPQYGYSQYYYDESTGYTYGFDQNTNQYYYYDPSTQEYIYYTTEAQEEQTVPEQVQVQDQDQDQAYSYEESSPVSASDVSSNPSLFTSAGPPMIALQAKSSSLGKASFTPDEVFNI